MANLFLAELVAALDRREPFAVATAIAVTGEMAPQSGRRLLLWADAARPPVGDLDVGPLAAELAGAARSALDERRHRTVTLTAPGGSLTAFIEVQAQPPHLIVVGAGHIAVPLAAIAKISDFEVTVLDDRPQYAHQARFPTADRVVAGPFRPELAALRRGRPAFDPHTYIVLVTRGHQHDVECLLEVLDDPVAYIGMIGSRRRVAAVFDLLAAEQGIAAEKFDRVRAPIGLDIGARTPAEIAVCIMAEIINVLRGGPAQSLSDQMRSERQARRARAKQSAAAPT